MKPEMLKRLTRIESELRRRTRVPLESVLVAGVDEAVAVRAIAGAEDTELRALHETLDEGEIEAIISEGATP